MLGQVGLAAVLRHRSQRIGESESYFNSCPCWTLPRVTNRSCHCLHTDNYTSQVQGLPLTSCVNPAYNIERDTTTGKGVSVERPVDLLPTCRPLGEVLGGASA